MMNIAEAIAKFKDSWDRATGPGSKFSENLTPEGRHIRRLLEDAPPEAVRALLGGVSVETRDAVPDSRHDTVLGQGHAGKAASCNRRVAAVLAIASLALCCASPWIAPKIWTGVACFACAALAGAAATVAMAKLGRGKDPARPLMETRAMSLPEISVATSALDKAVAVFSAALGNVIDSSREKEEDSALGFDITASKAFGDWVQKFVDEASRDGADDGSAMLKDELVSKLRTMGISVFDRIRRGKDGKTALPPRDAFRDSRPEGHDEFTRVVHAAVYSRRGILAVGELA